MLGECRVPGLIFGEPREQLLEVAEATHLVPAVLAETLERLYHDLGLQHVVEHGLEKVHDEVLLQVCARARRQLPGGRS